MHTWTGQLLLLTSHFEAQLGPGGDSILNVCGMRTSKDIDWNLYLSVPDQMHILVIELINFRNRLSIRPAWLFSHVCM